MRRPKEYFPIHKCKWCGTNVDPNKWCAERAIALVERTACFTCTFWLEKVEVKDDKRSVRVNGTHYFIGPENAGEVGRGFGGSKFRIAFHDGRRVESTNLWCQGNIPELWREQLPDNAQWDTLKELAEVEL
ncbi:MAG: hypothetical protein GTO63_21490 [Anaerolineae bacterium]|nr:hypothetical protein [Anaerolineae bacterium]NIQ80280.1 hypothetical protein [Anaerolineae bacterium]